MAQAGVGGYNTPVAVCLETLRRSLTVTCPERGRPLERLVVAITLFGALLLIIGAVSVVSPMTQLGIHTRGKSLILLSVGLLLFVSGPVLQTLTSTLPAADPQQARGGTQEDPTVIDAKAQLCDLANGVFQGRANISGRNRLRECAVTGKDGSYEVAIAFNADDRLTASMTREGIEQAMTRAYAALYTSGVPLQGVSIAAYLPFRGASGSPEDVRVYETRIDGASGRTMSPDQAAAPGVEGLWHVTELHPDLAGR